MFTNFMRGEIMKLVKAFLAILAVLVFSGMANAATVSLTPVADAFILLKGTGDSDYTAGNGPSLYVNYVSWKSDEAKAYIRYQLPSDFGTAISATFQITRVAVDAWDMNYDVYGLKDNVAGNDWQDLQPGFWYGAPSGGLTWNNAPANDQASGYGFTSDATGILGTFSTEGSNHVPPGSNHLTYSVSTTNLNNFLNSDTDKNITLMISRQGDSSSGPEFASRENGTYAAPTLVLIYTPTPEPATVVLLGLGVCGMLRKFRK
jgi:hypothetical protein